MSARYGVAMWRRWRGLLTSVVTMAVLACTNEPTRPDNRVVSVQVTPSGFTIEEGETVALHALPRNARGELVSGRPVAWSSDDEHVATVSPEGVVTGRADGSAYISATVDGRAGSTLVAVVPAAVASILVTPNRLDLRSTEGWNVVATAVDARGNALPGRAFTWESSNTDAAIVAPDGWVRAIAPGSAMLTVTTGGRSATIPVTVTSFTDYELVFERVVGGRSELFITDLNGGEPRPLLPGVDAREPAASPDGSRIAFVVVTHYAFPDGMEGDLYVVNRDGTGLTRLTSAPGLEHQPAWSPNGERIAYRGHPNGAGRRGDLWVMDADGRNAVNISPEGASDERDPSFSHDGNRVAYTSNVSGGTEVWTMASDGSDRQRLTFTNAYQARPVWSPDGKFLAFAQRLAGRSADLAVVTAAGADVVRLELPGDQESPAWSPESRLLAFASDHEGTRAIYELHLHSQDVSRRTRGGTRDGNPTWTRK